MEKTPLVSRHSAASADDFSPYARSLPCKLMVGILTPFTDMSMVVVERHRRGVYLYSSGSLDGATKIDVGDTLRLEI